ncbi:hypothetical protein Bca4012_062935 [Brassica carinata]|uniref:Uncharacterized protein n=1 Tax=Brassica carinata TaxID=52824 RepID=A0A8X7V594_BRACI|nr:hypothetical protein Bca52824_032551 [Brassica carinata]
MKTSPSRTASSSSPLQTEIAIMISCPIMFSDLKCGRASQSVVTHVLRFGRRATSKREDKSWG